MSKMTRVFAQAFVIAVAIFATVPSAQAYIGPGMGAGVIGTVLGVLGSIFLAIFAVLYYPFKRLFKRLKGARKAPPGNKP